MKWTTPRIVEIAVGLEINAYACAELNSDPRSGKLNRELSRPCPYLVT